MKFIVFFIGLILITFILAKEKLNNSRSKIFTNYIDQCNLKFTNPILHYTCNGNTSSINLNKCIGLRNGRLFPGGQNFNGSKVKVTVNGQKSFIENYCSQCEIKKLRELRCSCGGVWSTVLLKDAIWRYFNSKKIVCNRHTWHY